MGRKKPREETQSIESAVSAAFSDIEGLKDELQEWYDNLPQGPQNGSKGDMLQEAIGALEGDSEPTVPSEVGSFDVTYNVTTGARLSRADRRDNAVAALSAVASYIENYLSEMDEDEAEGGTDELETFKTECEEAVSNWEGVEFPGMFG